MRCITRCKMWESIRARARRPDEIVKPDFTSDLKAQSGNYGLHTGSQLFSGRIAVSAPLSFFQLLLPSAFRSPPVQIKFDYYSAPARGFSYIIPAREKWFQRFPRDKRRQITAREIPYSQSYLTMRLASAFKGL